MRLLFFFVKLILDIVLLVVGVGPGVAAQCTDLIFIHYGTPGPVCPGPDVQYRCG